MQLATMQLKASDGRVCAQSGGERGASVDLCTSGANLGKARLETPNPLTRNINPGLPGFIFNPGHANLLMRNTIPGLPGLPGWLLSFLC